MITLSQLSQWCAWPIASLCSCSLSPSGPPGGSVHLAERPGPSCSMHFLECGGTWGCCSLCPWVQRAFNPFRVSKGVFWCPTNVGWSCHRGQLIIYWAIRDWEGDTWIKGSKNKKTEKHKIELFWNGAFTRSNGAFTRSNGAFCRPPQNHKFLGPLKKMLGRSCSKFGLRPTPSPWSMPECVRRCGISPHIKLAKNALRSSGCLPKKLFFANWILGFVTVCRCIKQQHVDACRYKNS